MGDLEINRYTNRPITIEAVQLTDDADWNAIAAWCGTPPLHQHRPGDLKDQLAIPTLEGVIWASVGDWIIRGVKGEFYPCKPDIFEATYVAAAPADLAEERPECPKCGRLHFPWCSPHGGELSHPGGAAPGAT